MDSVSRSRPGKHTKTSWQMP